MASGTGSNLLKRPRHLALLAAATVATVLVTVAFTHHGTEKSGYGDVSGRIPPTFGDAPLLPIVPPVTVSPSKSPRPTGKSRKRKPPKKAAPESSPSPPSSPKKPKKPAPAPKKPPTDDEDGVKQSLQSVNYPERYIQKQGGSVVLAPVSSSSSEQTRQNATFTVVPGLADSDCYSFRAQNGEYLRHYGMRVLMDPSNGSKVFREDATFCPSWGWGYGGGYGGGPWGGGPWGGSSEIALESYNRPNNYLRHYNFELKLHPYEDTDQYRADSSFQMTEPLA